MKHTPFYDQHKKLGAKIVPFAGWDMPLSYTGVLEEHRATRTAIGLFDVSHMGRIGLAGPGADDVLDRLATASIRDLPIGGIRYALVLNERGGILDDVMIYRIGDRNYVVCANASNADKILQWIVRHAADRSDLEVVDRTTELVQLAVQGPGAGNLMWRLSGSDLNRMRIRTCVETKVAGVPMIVSRTGYTGEPGYELYIPFRQSCEVWESLIGEGRPLGLRPCGLGCRDTLRLEMGYPLYGNDLDETTTPIEADLEFAVDFEKGDFVGRDALVRQRRSGISRKLVGFELTRRGVPRHDQKIMSDGKEIGVVTSGNHSPSLNKGIGMGYVQPMFQEPGLKLQIDIRGNAVPAVVVERPFYRRRKE